MINKKVELNSNKFDWFDLFIYYYFYDVKIYCFLCIFCAALLRSLFTAKFHEVCFDEHVDVAIHNGTYVRGLVVGAVVFHAAVVEYI